MFAFKIHSNVLNGNNFRAKQTIKLRLFWSFSTTVLSKQQSVIVTAFAWDGKAYKPVGKVGLAILTKEEKPLMVLYKSKQQTLSTLDLSQEQLKVEHQSENVLGTLDMQVKISKRLKVYYVKKRSLLKLSR